jgi:deoxyribonucleoside regulator
MPDLKIQSDRASLLADVAEMYYWEGKNQDEIAAIIGVTRSMVSRLLTEARLKGIIEVRVHRPIQYNHSLEDELINRFGLLSASVIEHKSKREGRLLKYLGQAGAEMLKKYLKPDSILGLAWGTSVDAVVREFEVEAPVPVKVVQLVGALGARNNQYDGHGLVQRMVEKINGEGYFLNAPFICSTPEISSALKETPGIRETVAMHQMVNLTLAGVGSTSPKYSSYYLAGYVPIEELNQLVQAGAVGDVCGLHFDLQGDEVCQTFCERLVTISREDLFEIPVRMGIAGGPGKVQPALGAVRGGYINTLVTDDQTARQILALDGPR